jgi:hypothetical protein
MAVVVQPGSSSERYYIIALPLPTSKQPTIVGRGFSHFWSRLLKHKIIIWFRTLYDVQFRMLFSYALSNGVSPEKWVETKYWMDLYTSRDLK